MRPSEDGFLLVSVLWFLAAISIGITYLSENFDRNIENVFDARREFYNRLDEYGSKETILYLLASRERSFKGIEADRKLRLEPNRDPLSVASFKEIGNVISLRNQPYLGFGNCKFSLQDSGSLISLRSKNSAVLKKFLVSMGKSRSEAESLTRKLQDYVDRDDNMLLSGGEARSYPKSDRAYFPRNRYLSNPGELRNVLSWTELLSEYEIAQLINETTVHVGDRWNLNSMTERRIRQTLSDESMARKIIAHRQSSFFSSAADLRDVLGLVDSDVLFGSSYLPSNYVIISILCSEKGPSLKVGVTMTPRSATAPWEIDYETRHAGVFVHEKEYENFDPSDNELSVQRHALFSDRPGSD